MLNCLVTHIIITTLERKIPPPDRWYNDSYPGENIRNDAQTALFKQLPNANEMAWYCLKGDPHIDKDKLYSFVGHLWKGGMWFLKKEKISGFSTEQTPRW